MTDPVVTPLPVALPRSVGERLRDRDTGPRPPAAFTPQSNGRRAENESPPAGADEHDQADEGPLTPADKIRAALLTSAELRRLPPPEPLVDGLIYRNAHTLFYAASGAGKSFVSIDIALHVATGIPWHGRAVADGPVLYVVGEGVSGTGMRLDAWDAHHDYPTPKHAVHWLPWAVSLHDPAWAGGLAEVVGEMRPVLVVIDTYARSTAGADENSAKDTGIIVHHLDQIRTAAGSAVMLVHHSGKDTTAGARGSSALRAAVDTELQLEGDRHHLVLSTKKQKDAPEADPVHLALTPVSGTDSAVITGTARTEEPSWHGPTRCMDAVADWFAGKAGLELSTRQAIAQLRAHWTAHDLPSFKDSVVSAALEQLAVESVLIARNGPRNSRLFTLNPDHSECDHESF